MKYIVNKENKVIALIQSGDINIQDISSREEFIVESDTFVELEFAIYEDGVIKELIPETLPNPYNGDTLISWAMAQLFAAELIPHFAAFLDFANKGTDASAANFRAYAAAVEQSIMAEQIVAKAIELGANITVEE